MALEKIGPNKWRIKVSVRVPGQDEPVKKRETFTGTKIEAEGRKAEIIKQLRSGSLTVEQSTSTFSDVIKAYKENLRIRGKLSRFHEVKIDCMNRELGNISLEQFPDRFEAYLRILRNTPTRTGRARSNASTNRYIEIARAAFGFLVKTDRIQKNPITQARFPKGEEKPRDRYLTEDERLKLLNAIEQHRPYLLPFIEYNLAVPCRKGELIPAKREQYNAFTNTVYIPDSKAGIPIHKPVPDSMREYFRSIPPECPWLFYRQDAAGNYHSLGDPKKAWRFCLKKAGLVNVRIHDLRHISASDMYSAGNPERQIMDIAGWLTPMLSQYRHRDSLKSAQTIRWAPAISTPTETREIKLSSM